ncbi:hypothetical protein ACE193_03780 [Bernardetia sp. OM2101]|uniref:hypothetical protein n=1 Tax=Bernardetia sp. OM2101 TaxID=3344876 RepID=UPI0035D098AB
MNRIITMLMLIILTSCGQEKNTSDINTKNELNADTIKTKKAEDISTDIITYFTDFQTDSIKIEVEAYIETQRFLPKDCLPLKFLPLLDNKIPQTQSESTGAKPVGKIKINNNHYFLVIVQQDDYGPIYYGLTYDSDKNKIQNSDKIAEIWGDAGDSQITYSIVSVTEQKVQIDKFIETCHANLEVPEEEMMETDMECSDSTATIEFKINTD